MAAENGCYDKLSPAAAIQPKPGGKETPNGYFFDTTSVGYYGIAAMIPGFMMQLPGVAREVLEPRMMRSVAERSPDFLIDEFLVKPLVNTAYLAPFLIGPVFFALPAAIPLLLPRYLPSIVPAQLLVLGVYFAALSHGPRMFVVARKWQWTAALLLPAVVAANIAMDVAFIKSGYGLGGVATGSGLAYALLFVSLFGLIARKLDSRSPAWKRHVPAMLLPFPVMCATLYALQAVMPHLIRHAILGACVNTVIFLAVMTLVYQIARKRLPMLKGLEV